MKIVCDALYIYIMSTLACTFKGLQMINHQPNMKVTHIKRTLIQQGTNNAEANTIKLTS